MQISLSSKNNKNQPIKALELHIKIFLQNIHDIYFSYKVHHIRSITKLESYFSELPMIYYVFSKKQQLQELNKTLYKSITNLTCNIFIL
jgi:hypothetical protein